MALTGHTSIHVLGQRTQCNEVARICACLQRAHRRVGRRRFQCYLKCLIKPFRRGGGSWHWAPATCVADCVRKGSMIASRLRKIQPGASAELRSCSGGDAHYLRQKSNTQLMLSGVRSCLLMCSSRVSSRFSLMRGFLAYVLISAHARATPGTFARPAHSLVSRSARWSIARAPTPWQWRHA